MRKTLSLLALLMLVPLGGCVVYARPAPVVYTETYYGPDVVYVHSGYYCHGGYYRR